MDKMQAFLLARDSKTYTAYYNGKMSYALHGESWEAYVVDAFPDLRSQQTSENVFKAVIDLYAENLVPVPQQLRGFSNSLVPLLSRGEAPVIVDRQGEPHYPERFEMISDGRFTVAAVFTRSIQQMQDYVTFAYSDGRTMLFAKDVPDDFAPADRQGYQFVEATTGNELLRFALDDKGFGASLAALQDRVNHSIIDQTVIAEMYARPFWYLLNVSLPPDNPYLPAGATDSGDLLREQDGSGAAGRIFTTSSEGPFGQLDPPTISDMIAYHDSIIDKVSQSSGIPQHYFKPGEGTPPTGVALKVLSKRFNNKIARMRDDLTPEMERLATLLGVERTAQMDGRDGAGFELWNTTDDLLQESLDAHGLALSQMGYPLQYIAEVVTPGVNLADYEDDSLGEPVPAAAVDMTALGQTARPATPGQVAAYVQRSWQRARGGVT